MISEIKININRCTNGIYLRWWFNGWHYFLFNNKYEIQMRTESMDTQTLQVYSTISKLERPTKLKSEYFYQVEVSGITAGNIDGFNSLLMAEKVEQYETGWYEVDITRGKFTLKEEAAPGYSLTFEITRKELPNTPAVFQKSQLLYIGDTLADLDDDEIIPINKQVNDIADMQDRQSDYTAQFKVRKTRLMKALFELSGEVGANTLFPYEKQTCKLIQEGIEIISNGYMVLDKVDDQYYYISIYSGNLNFFKEIEDKKLTDLLLPSTNHTWNAATQAASNSGNINYIYPLMEPSNDGGIIPLVDDGSRCEVYGGWIWPFVKVKAIWDEIFSNSGYAVEGDILTDSRMLALFMPICNRNISNGIMADHLYSLLWNGFRTFDVHEYNQMIGLSGLITLISGDVIFKNYGIYMCPYTAKYTLRIGILCAYDEGFIPSVYLYVNNVNESSFTLIENVSNGSYLYEVAYDATINDQLTFFVGYVRGMYLYTISVIDITLESISYGATVTPALNLPDISQIDFVKMICNMFALIPEANPRDHKILFWSYKKLYENIPQARDWSAYLSERDDEIEFKFGDYAQNNYLKYKESDDVVKDLGTGIMQVNDETLLDKKDILQLPVSTCDEVLVLTDINVSRIGMNTYQPDDNTYEAEESIDPRIVNISQISGTKTFGIRDALIGGTSYDVVGPKKASSIEVSFGSLMSNYGPLSNMLNKTNLRRAKFNLPVYEVAGFKHYMPIYLRQYKAYFYVNKINNYVPGKLCTIDLIKL